MYGVLCFRIKYGGLYIQKNIYGELCLQKKVCRLMYSETVCKLKYFLKCVEAFVFKKCIEAYVLKKIM
jgi:hypothetical protein